MDVSIAACTAAEACCRHGSFYADEVMHHALCLDRIWSITRSAAFDATCSDQHEITINAECSLHSILLHVQHDVKQD